jgi:hypothetical protein
MQTGPAAYGGQQGGQPYYNMSMQETAEDPFTEMLRKQGTQLGAGQVSGGLGSAPGQPYPSLGGMQSEPWKPADYDPNLLGMGQTGNILQTKPGGDTDPADPLKVVTKPKILPDLPDYGPPPDTPPGDIIGGGMTLPGGETVGGGPLGGPDPKNPLQTKPAGGDNRTLVTKPGGGLSTGGNNTLMTKGLGQMGSGLAERKRDLGGAGGGGWPNDPLPAGWQETMLPGGTRKRWGPSQPNNTLVMK